MYEIIYDYEDEKNIRKKFDGDWTALQEYIHQDERKWMLQY